MKKTLLTIIAAAMTLGAAAIPARPGTFTVMQKDGTVLTLRMVGDEHFHYFVNVDNGRTMLQRPDAASVNLEQAEYYYVSEGELAPLRAAADVRRQQANERRQARLGARVEAACIAITPDALMEQPAGPHKMTAGEFNGAMKGSKKGLVILMEFPDLKFKSHNDRAAYDRVFNQEGYNDYGSIGSVHDYFKDQSYGEFDLTFDVVGPYTADNNMSYYGTNQPFPNDTYNWGIIQDLKACILPMEAVQKADPDVNFKDYDWDGDGEVDQVYIIYPGYAESSGAPANTIWPHESSLSQWAQYNSYFGSSIPTVSTLRLDGVKIDTYAMSQELTSTSGSTRVGIGTACHEFAHCLGFPDIYDINQQAFGMEAFDLMDNGGYNGPTYNCEVPAGFTAYERWMSGWLEPVVLSEGAAVKDMAALCDKPEAYVIYNEGNKNEYFLLENRQPKGWHKYVRNWSIPGGLLVTHVDFDKTAWATNQVNTNILHQHLTLVPAGKSYGTTAMGYTYTYESDYRSMLYPGSKNVTELNDESHMNVGMKLFNRNTDGSYKLGAPLHEISADATKGTVSFIFKDGPDDGNRWTVTYDAGPGQVSPASWTQTKQNEAVSLPVATLDETNWTFLGWTTDFVEPTQTRPAGVLEAGALYKPEADVTLHALYGFAPGTAAGDDYQVVEELRGGAQYVFCNKGKETDVTIYALNKLALLEDNYIKTPSGKAIDVDFTGVPTIHEPAASLVWTTTLTGQGYTLENNGSYLQITANGFGLTRTPSYLNWSPKFGLYGTVNGLNYYARVQSGKFQIATTGNETSRLFAYELPTAGTLAKVFSSDATLGDIVLDGMGNLLAPSASPVLYDLQGRPAAAGNHGVFIQGGRKVIR
ncbi:MAG: M6 family metalloprotease domain-containing protein [Bacteroidales bacterium]|nr:M6 family metalloprotease domain-containing protein [Bacteroidales bacterium]